MNSTRSLLLGALLLSACSSPFEPLPDSATVSWGNSFGECIGYCREELALVEGLARLEVNSWGSEQHPALSYEADLPAQDWDMLKRLVGRSGIEDLQDVYGCPDCADGGAEWIEVRADQTVKRVTFEFGDPPEPLAELVTQLRSLRAQFPAR